GLGAAVGTAIARPDHTVLVVLDGDTLVGASAALITAVAEGVPLVVAACNHGSDDLAMVARGLGADGATIVRPGEIEDLQSRLNRGGCPLVLDLRLPGPD